MNENVFVDLLRDTLFLIIKISSPMLITSLVLGLIISILQTVTSIQEQTLTFVPKLIGVFIVIMLFGNWIFRSCVDYFEMLMNHVGEFILRY